MVGLWRGVRTTEGFTFLRNEIDAGAPVLSLAILTVIVGAAALLSGWSLFSFPATIYALTTTFLGWVFKLVRAALQLIALTAEPAEKTLIALIMIPASIGALCWNWFVSGGGYYLHFGEIALRPVSAVAEVEPPVAHDPKPPSRNGTATPAPATAPLRGLASRGAPAAKTKELPASPFGQQPRRPAPRTPANGTRLRRQAAE